MNKVAFIGVEVLMAGCMAVNARTFHTGHLFVALTDRETGGPITNATVTVRCQTKLSVSHTLESFLQKRPHVRIQTVWPMSSFSFARQSLNGGLARPRIITGRLVLDMVMNSLDVL